MTKTQENIIYQRVKRPATTLLYCKEQTTVWQRQHETQVTKNIHKRCTPLGTVSKKITGGLKYVWRYQPRGQKFHLSACNYNQKLERTSNSSQRTHPALERNTRGSHITSLCSLLHTLFEGKVLVFAGRVKIVSFSPCRTSAILKYFCPLQPHHYTFYMSNILWTVHARVLKFHRLARIFFTSELSWICIWVCNPQCFCYIKPLNNGFFTTYEYFLRPKTFWTNSIYCKIFIYVCTTNFGPFGEVGAMSLLQVAC